MKNISAYKDSIGNDCFSLWHAATTATPHSSTRNIKRECEPLAVEPPNGGLNREQADNLISHTISKYKALAAKNAGN